MDLGLEEVAQLLNVPSGTVKRWLDANVIPAYTLNDQVLFNRGEIENWLLSNPVPQRERSESGSWKYSLYRAICRGGVVSGRGQNKEELIRSSTDELARDFGLDGEALTALLLERERLMSTGIGHGLAVPHARDFLLPMRFDIVRLVLCEEPVEFGSLDGQPVHCLFFLFACDDRRHLHLLAKLAHFANQREAQALLRKKPSSQELLGYIKEWESVIQTN